MEIWEKLNIFTITKYTVSMWKVYEDVCFMICFLMQFYRLTKTVKKHYGLSLTATHSSLFIFVLLLSSYSHLCSFYLSCPLLSLCPFLTSLILPLTPVSTFFHSCFPLGFFLPGEAACKHIFKIPLCNLVGRSIERPLKSPLVNKVLTTPASVMVPPTPLISATHSLSLSRMEIKEIASRTRKELLGKLKLYLIMHLL